MNEFSMCPHCYGIVCWEFEHVATFVTLPGCSYPEEPFTPASWECKKYDGLV